MPDVTVTAVRTFLFKGEQVKKGENVTLPAIEAAVEARKGNVSLARVQVRSLKAETPKPEPPKPKRTRRTRRNGTPVPFTEEEPQQSAPETSQQYRRRDMTAEDPT